MKVTTITCPKCKDTIYSRARHDFRWCSCENVAIDGGLDYTKITGKGELGSLEVEVDKYDLYNDWNYSIDKLGLIKGETDESSS